MAFFELRSPRDMFQKAEREFHRLQHEFTIDHVFNFFVTAYHIKDYVEKATSTSSNVLQTFLTDTDLRDCRDLCDKGKHLRLTKRNDPTTVIWDGTLGGAPLNELPLGGGDKWVLFSGDREIDVEWLAERVIEKWRGFLVQHRL
jgi:hypothetical protein